MDQEKLIKHIIDPESGVDQTKLKQEILDDQKLLKEYSRLKNARALFASVSSPEDPDIKGQLDAAKVKLGLKKKRKPAVMYELLKYAAVILITFSIAFFALNRPEAELVENQSYTVEVPYGETASITLADGTKVWLNSGTKINYLASFGMNTRAVHLTGEAFFSVTKNEKLPFIVETDLIDIEVTGTEFNVTSYANEDQILTTLVEGGVTVKDKKGKALHYLKPEEQAILYKSEKRTSVEKVNVSSFTSWKDGVMIFEEVPLERILNNIERWYNVDVILGNNSIRKKLFSGAILKNNPLDHILDVLVESSEIREYQIKNREGQRRLIIMK